MENKLNDLEKIMNRAVYQKQRFTEQSKQAVMDRIKSPKQKKRRQLFDRIQYGMSLFVFTLIFGFLLGMFTGVLEDDFLSADQKINSSKPVASLPLINRVVQLSHHQDGIVNIIVSKSNHYIELTFEFSENVSEKQMKQKINTFLKEGSRLSKDVQQLRMQGNQSIDVWSDYTLTIYARSNLSIRQGKAEMIDTTMSLPILQGIKNPGELEVDWIEVNQFEENWRD